MNGLKYFIAITDTVQTEVYLDFLKSHGANFIMYDLCEGTASTSMLSMLGLEKNEKVIIQTVLRNEDLTAVISDIRKEFYARRGSGIAFSVPIDGVGGKTALINLVGEQPLGESNMETSKSNCVAIITIADKGNVDLIMDAARGAGATGGTVVSAKGTGKDMIKFFGMTISEEKDMVYVIAKREIRDVIMQSIMNVAGAKTNAHGIVFSLPVDKVVGVSAFEEN